MGYIYYMKKFIKTIFAATIASALVAPMASATILNPDPTKFSSDTGAELFNPLGNVFFGLEFQDIAANFTQSIFGFYFDGTDPTNPANRIALWGPGSHNTDPSQAAIVDLANSTVYDANTFTIKGSFSSLDKPIGFFYELPEFNNFVIYSQSSLNNGQDLFAVFPLISDPSVSVLGIQVGDNAGGFTTLAYEVVANSVPVPAPGSLALLMSWLVFIRLWISRTDRA
jgi:hypothetical protein